MSTQVIDPLSLGQPPPKAPAAPQWAAYAKPGPYVTKLPPEDERQFQSWVKQNKVPWRDSPTADYDMRGYWKAMVSGDRDAHTSVDPEDHLPHYPDTWKTPYHKTFSNESEYALPTAGTWKGETFVPPKAASTPASGVIDPLELQQPPATPAAAHEPQMGPREPGFLERFFAPVREGAIGHSVDETMPKLADAFPTLFHPTETASNPEQAEHENEALPLGAAVSGPGAAKGAAEFAGGLTTAPSVLLMGGGPAVRMLEPLVGEAGVGVINKLIQAGFSAQMLAGAARQSPELVKAVKEGDYKTAEQMATEMALGSAFATHLAKGLHEAAPVTGPELGNMEVEQPPKAPTPELPAGKTPAALPPKPGVPDEQLRSQKGPSKKPIALPAQNPTRIPPGREAIAAPASTAVVEARRPAAKSNGAEPQPQSAADLKLEIAKLDNRERAINEQMIGSRPGTDTSQRRIQQLKQISAQRSELRTKLNELEPRPEAKPLSKAPGEDEKPGPRIGGTPTYAQPRAKAEAPKRPTYDKLPPELREVVDRVAEQHAHLPQSLREADEAEHKKLSAPGTPLKEQVARRISRDEGLPYADRDTGEMIHPKPEAKPLSDRRTPIGERRLENEGPPEGNERRTSDRRTATDMIRDQARQELRDEEVRRREEMGFSDIGQVRKQAEQTRGEGNVPKPPAGMEWKLVDKGEPSKNPTREQMARAKTEGAPLPGMERAVEQQKQGAEKVKGEQLSKEIARPLSNIDERAGAMERESPLFRDTEASGQGGLFRPRAEEEKPQGGHAGAAAASEEELNRTGEHYSVSKSGNVTYHGKSFAPEMTPKGGAHVTVLPGEDIRVNAGELTPSMKESLGAARADTLAGRSMAQGLLGKGSKLHAGVDPEMVRELFNKVGNLYDEHVAGPAIEKMGLGRTHKDVEAVDPKLASRIRRYEAAPLYFKTKAEDLVKHIVGGLTPEKERLFTLMADADARENLKDNHPKEYAKALGDRDVKAALDRYRPWEQQLTKARQILGGQTLSRDYLRRVYQQHTEGIGKATKGKTTPRANFDRVITPQKEGGPGRKASAEHHYEHGLHEFGPAFGTKFVGTMMKIAEHATAVEFLRKATKLESGDALPPVIDYNGEKFYRPDVVRMIHEARPGEDSKAIARDLGVKQLPTPKEAQAYEVYDPAPGKGSAEGPKYLGPRSVVDALHGLNKTEPGRSNPIGRFLREQIIGVGFGVPHAMNLARRISQSFPGGSGNPVNWVRAVRALTSHELRTRSLSRTNDPAYDSLLRWGGMSPHRVESYKEYQGGNLNPANWLRLFAHVGHQWLFGPKGIDRSARLYVHDLIRSQRPDLSAERTAQLVNDQLGRYNRASWTDLQKRVGRYMLFPGWDFSSMNWVLRHPIRTTVPPAVLIMLANNVIHHYGGNRDEDRFDPFAVHVGHHSYGAGLVNEPLAKRLAAPVGGAVKEELDGGTRRQVAAAAGRELPYAVGAPFGMTMPQVRLPVELALGKDEFGRDIVPRGDWTRPGQVLPSRGLEDQAAHALVSFFPQGQRIEEGRQNAAEMALSNLGVQRKADQPRLPEENEKRADVANVRDDLRQVREQARAIAMDKGLSEDEKEKRLEDLRDQARRMVARDRPQ